MRALVALMMGCGYLAAIQAAFGYGRGLVILHIPLLAAGSLGGIVSLLRTWSSGTPWRWAVLMGFIWLLPSCGLVYNSELSLVFTVAFYVGVSVLAASYIWC